MLLQEVAEDVNNYLHEKQFVEIFTGKVRQSNDGPLYLHILGRLAPKGAFNWDEDTTSVLSMSGRIKELLEKAVDNPSHFEKVHWFANYFNEVLRELRGLAGTFTIEGPGLDARNWT
jgi:hypothetical protein